MPRRAGPETEPGSHSVVNRETGRKKIDRETFISEATERLQVIDVTLGEHQIKMIKFKSFVDRVKTYSDFGYWRVKFFTNDQNIIAKVQRKHFGFVIPPNQPDSAQDEVDHLPRYFDIDGPLAGAGAIVLPDEVAAQLDLDGDKVKYDIEKLLELGGEIVFDDYELPESCKPITSIDYWLRMKQMEDDLYQEKAQIEAIRDRYVKIIEEALNSELASGLRTTFYLDVKSRELSSERIKKASIGFDRDQS